MPYVHLLRTLLHQGLGNVHESQITPDSVKAARSYIIITALLCESVKAEQYFSKHSAQY